MKISLDAGDAVYRIEHYRSGEYLVVNRQHYNHSVIVTPTLLQVWLPAGFDDLRAEHFALLVPLTPDCILFGSGSRFRFPSPDLIAPLVEHGIGVEVMDTAAACRTYSVLTAEGRRVAAALLI